MFESIDTVVFLRTSGVLFYIEGPMKECILSHVFFFETGKSISDNYFVFLKLLSAIFYQIFIFQPNDSLSKSMKNVFLFHLNVQM